MSNRLLALFILVVTIGGLILTYLYFFVFYGASVKLQGNVSGYALTFATEKLSNPINYSCDREACIFDKIAPFQYTITISKEGYKDHVIQKKIQSRGEQLIDFILVEETILETLEAVVSPQEILQKKRDRIKYKDFFLYYDFGEDGIFYMREYLGKLFLYRDQGEDSILIYDFPRTSHNNIHITQVYNTAYFSIGIGGKNYLFNNNTAEFRNIDLQLKVLYGKKGKDETEIILLTEKGAYVHDLMVKKSQYYYLFHDYVYTENATIIGIVTIENSEKRSQLGLPNDKQNYIMSYDPKTKEYMRLFKTGEKIEEVYFQGRELILKIGGITQRLENYKK